MAARYWVGGTASWDATAGTKWSTVDGGVGGAAVPTSADDVYFTAASGTNTVSINSTALCKNLDFTGFTGAITGSGNLAVDGNFTAVSSMNWILAGQLNFNATSGSFTIKTNGRALSGSITFGSSNGTPTYTLQDALTTTGSLTVRAGTFDTGNYAVTATGIAATINLPRTINLGSSTVTLSSSSPIDFTTNTNLTFNAGTSQIICTGNNVTITGGGVSGTGVTFYNVSFTAATSGFAKTIQSSNTFNNFNVTAPISAGVTNVTFNSPQTINGTLSTTGTAGNRRVWFQGVTYGLAQTLTINSAPSLTDADFRDIYVIGTAAPISGTRIGDLRGCSGITFDAPKTVYWNLAGTQNWSANGWAATSTGTPSTDYFPLAQDTAKFTTAGSVGTITMDTAIPYTGTVDMSGRIGTMTLTPGAYSIYGDWKNTNSGLTLNSGGPLTFSGRNTQTITSAGQAFNTQFTIDSYGGTVQLADAINTGTQTLVITNGTFTTNGYAVTINNLSSINSNVRTINLGASTVTLSGSTTFSPTTNLTFNAGTSSIVHTTQSAQLTAGGVSFYNVSFTSTASTNTPQIIGANTFNNLSFSSSSTVGSVIKCTFNADQIINGTLTCSGATAVRRIFLVSNTLGTTRTLTVNSLSANDCDFRDITIAGAAAGTSPTRAGDCGGNSGITFPAPKTVYWNLTGVQNWSATAWATSSGGTPALANFPLAQDTAVIDDTGSATTISFNASWNVGTFNTANRTSAVTFGWSTSSPVFYGNFSYGTGVTVASSNNYIVFSGRGTQTLTSNGVSTAVNITVDNFSGTLQLADALTLTSVRILTLTSGTFDAVSYNVTTGLFANGTGTSTIKMGSGTWTLSGTAAVWNLNTSVSLYKGTANIVLSDTSASARSFVGAGFSYNKLTIGGTTGTSTLTISGANQFTELASTKTVAHTITFPSSTTTTIGKWSVTGTAGNVVTLAPSTAATTYTISIAGAAPSGIDYLSLSYCTLSSTSPAEFFVGANSTNGAGNVNVTFTATPAPRTLYWVGGTGNWSDTAHWSTTSGSGSGAAVPTSLDSVNFNSGSNATAYTATIDPTQARCAALNIAGPASGNVTIAGTGGLAIAGNTTIAATGVTRTYTGAITLTGAGSYTFTTNGVALASTTDINGVGSTWTLGSTVTTSSVSITNGNFSTSNYNVTLNSISSNNSNTRTIDLGSSTISLTGSATFANFGTTPPINLTLNSGTSTLSASSGIFSGGGLTWYNLTYTSTGISTSTINGANTFNNLSVAGRTSIGIAVLSLSANQTINGTLTLSAGTAAAYRTMIQSDTLGTARTLTCNAVAALQDIDFRDITIAGNAVSGGNLTGTRLGDCKGNTGITFDAPKTVYWASSSGGNWGVSTVGSWSGSNNNTPDATKFPLAQDTAIISSSYPNAAQPVTINANYNIGTIDMSGRTSNTLTLATGTTTPIIYGNWVNGTGVTLSGTSLPITFAGRGSQTITSAGVTFTQAITINSLGGSVTLQDAITAGRGSTGAISVVGGTFNANSYNVTISGGGTFTSTGTATRTVAVGSGTWSLAGSSTVWDCSASTGLTVTGSGTISLTSASSKTFAGGGLNYSGITLNQGGAGALTITGNNTFGNITNTYSATGAAIIALGTTTQTLNNFTATGASGKVLTVQGTSASSPGTLILNSGTVSTVDYLTITGIRAYSLNTTWYAGTHSTNYGSLGWIFSAAPTPPVTANSGFFFMMGC